MRDEQEFRDYYGLLQVDHDCDERGLELAYHHFAKLYHPDNADTGDVEKFGEIVGAYKILRDPAKRAEYDRTYFAVMQAAGKRFDFDSHNEIDERTAISDAEIHSKILFQLYKKRRERASDAGVVGWILQENLGCSDDQFEFHAWYLKSKGFLDVTEQGTLAITISGVDHVIATSHATVKEKLLIAHADTTRHPQ